MRTDGHALRHRPRMTLGSSLNVDGRRVPCRVRSRALRPWTTIACLFGILLWWPQFLARQAYASGPDPSRPIKQMRHASWNEASGLSGVVYSLAQTADGFLWIGTSTGLYRFDGLKFEPFLELAAVHHILVVCAFIATCVGCL